MSGAVFKLFIGLGVTCVLGAVAIHAPQSPLAAKYAAEKRADQNARLADATRPAKAAPAVTNSPERTGETRVASSADVNKNSKPSATAPITKPPTQQDNAPQQGAPISVETIEQSEIRPVSDMQSKAGPQTPPPFEPLPDQITAQNEIAPRGASIEDATPSPEQTAPTATSTIPDIAAEAPEVDVDAPDAFWTATLEAGLLAFTGAIPNREAQDAIEAFALQRFPEITLANGSSVGAQNSDDDRWLSTARYALEALARLNNGTVTISGDTISIIGEAAPASLGEAEQILSQAPTRYTTLIDIKPSAVTEDDPDTIEPRSKIAEIIAKLPPTPSRAPDRTETLQRGQAQTGAPACMSSIRRALSQSLIRFSPLSVDIYPMARSTLIDVADAMRACPAAQLEVVGHSDATGEIERNIGISRQRADAVVFELTAFGVPSDRLSARGAGASNPIASNETETGRARNRRIEFILSTLSSEE